MSWKRPSSVMRISEAQFTAIDFESAGTAPGLTDAPVQVGIASWSVADGFTDPWVSYLHCDREITWAARKVHGISLEDLRGAPSLLELWPTLKARLGAGPVVAHAVGTERRFLRAFPGHSFGPWVDTLPVARAAWPGLPSHRLGKVAEAQGLSDFSAWAEGRSWHDALFDALASLAILGRVVDEFDLQDAPVEVLLRPDTTVWQNRLSP